MKNNKELEKLIGDIIMEKHIHDPGIEFTSRITKLGFKELSRKKAFNFQPALVAPILMFLSLVIVSIIIPEKTSPFFGFNFSIAFKFATQWPSVGFTLPRWDNFPIIVLSASLIILFQLALLKKLLIR